VRPFFCAAIQLLPCFCKEGVCSPMAGSEMVVGWWCVGCCRSGLPLLQVSLAVAVGALATFLLLGKKKGSGAKKDEGKPAAAAAKK
jgi:hypothetical protein